MTFAHLRSALRISAILWATRGNQGHRVKLNSDFVLQDLFVRLSDWLQHEFEKNCQVDGEYFIARLAAANCWVDGEYFPKYDALRECGRCIEKAPF